MRMAGEPTGQPSCTPHVGHPHRWRPQRKPRPLRTDASTTTRRGRPWNQLCRQRRDAATRGNPDSMRSWAGCSSPAARRRRALHRRAGSSPRDRDTVSSRFGRADRRRARSPRTRLSSMRILRAHRVYLDQALSWPARSRSGRPVEVGPLSFPRRPVSAPPTKSSGAVTATVREKGGPNRASRRHFDDLDWRESLQDELRSLRVGMIVECGLSPAWLLTVARRKGTTIPGGPERPPRNWRGGARRDRPPKPDNEQSCDSTTPGFAMITATGADMLPSGLSRDAQCLTLSLVAG